MVVAVGNRVLIYDGSEGELLHSLRGHKDTVSNHAATANLTSQTVDD